MGQINLQHEAEVRGKRHHFVDTKADKVQSVSRLNRSVLCCRGLRRRQTWPMLVPANLSMSTFQSPATTQLGIQLQQRQQSGYDGDIGLRLEPRAGLEVHGNNHQPPLHPRQLDGKEATPFNTERLDQARVGLPGCGNHKTPFPVIGRRGTGPKGVKHFTEKGGLCPRLLLQA